MQQGQKQNLKLDKAYFITMTVVGWVDVFTRKNHRDAITTNYQDMESLIEVEKIAQRLITFN